MERLPSNAIDGCRAKIARVDETLGQLRVELNDWLNSKPKPYRIVGAHHNNHCEFGFTVYGEAVPLRFSIFIGEIVHHLRSCLDHVAWSLATKNIGVPSNRIQFPICDTREKFEKAETSGTIKGVGRDAAALIRNVQPFMSSTPKNTPLYLLHQLDIHDKHRLLIVIGGAVSLGNELRIGDVPGILSERKSIAITGMSPPAFAPITPTGSRVFTVYFEGPTPECQVDADFETTILFEELGLEKDVKVITALEGMREGVLHTLQKFIPLLDGTARAGSSDNDLS